MILFLCFNLGFFIIFVGWFDKYDDGNVGIDVIMFIVILLFMLIIFLYFVGLDLLGWLVMMKVLFLGGDDFYIFGMVMLLYMGGCVMGFMLLYIFGGMVFGYMVVGG